MSKHWSLHAFFLLAEALLMSLFVALLQENGGRNAYGSLWQVGVVGVFGVVALVSTLLVALTQGSGWTKGIHAVLGSLFLLVGGAIPGMKLSRAVSEEWRKQAALECFQLHSWDITPPPGRRLRVEGELGHDGVLAFIMLQGQGLERGGYDMTWATIQLDRLTFVPEAVFSGGGRNMTLRLPLPRPSSSR
jgi:hypothetical protein